MARILIVYSTTDGHTREICNRLREVIERQEHQVTLVPVVEAADADLEPCDKIVVGASIRYGKHSPLVVDFIERNAPVIRGIMWLTGGPTDPKSVVELTDWRQVEVFGSLIARM